MCRDYVRVKFEQRQRTCNFVNGKTVVQAEAPQGELAKYATDLRSMTQGRGRFSVEFERYEEVPPQAQAKIIEEAKAAKKD